MTAEEAKEMGFIDVIDEEEKDEKAKATLFDLSVFANVPDQLMGEKQEPTVKDLEKALRDVGCSQKKAKTILAKGFEGYQRDVDEPENPEPEGKEVQRDAEPVTQRDVEKPKPKKDQTAEPLTRAEVVAPAKPKAKDKVAELLLKADLLNM